MPLRPLFDLQTPGYGCNRASTLTEGLTLTIFYTCDDEESDAEITRRVTFSAVVAYRFCSEAHTSGWPTEAADAVACFEGSEWVKALKARVPDGPMGWLSRRRHFVLCLRNHGCYDIVADSVEPPEQVGDTQSGDYVTRSARGR